MGTLNRLEGIGLLVGTCLCVAAIAEEPAFPGADWERPSPIDSGWSAEKLDEARAFSEQIGSTAIAVVHDGVLVAEWGRTDDPINCYSIRKSLLCALIGRAVESGALDPEATLADLKIDDNEPSLTQSEKRATVRDLLTSRSGVYHPAAYEALANARERPERGSHAPGTFFYYNNWDFNALGSIYNQATDSDLFEDFERLIAKPLGMQDFGPEHCEYRTERKSEHPAYLFKMSARDLARFGLLYLRGGAWDDAQIIPAGWVERSTSTQVPNATEHRSYGYLWWTYPGAGTYEASGKGGQKVYVMPARKMVIVHLVDVAPFGDEGVSHGQFFQLVRKILDAAPE